MRRRLGKWLALVLLLGANAAPAGAGERPTASLGRRIYNFRCYFCHGYAGDGQTVASSFLQPKPRDFTATSPTQLDASRMREAVRNGRPGTAMQGFGGVLTPEEIAAVVDFVRQEFMQDRARNTHYHTPENGWPAHQQYAAAFPFVTGELPLRLPPEQLSPPQRAGRQLYLSACVSCHDRPQARPSEGGGLAWETQTLSYPRNGFVPGQAPRVDTVSGASPYAVHDQPPALPHPSPQEQRGEALFQANCAFCHAADGTGRNWIGSFLQPHPRDLTNRAFMARLTPQRLTQVIREGLPGTSMPAWKTVLSGAQIDAVVAYVGRVFPLGPAATAGKHPPP